MSRKHGEGGADDAQPGCSLTGTTAAREQQFPLCTQDRRTKQVFHFAKTAILLVLILGSTSKIAISGDQVHRARAHVVLLLAIKVQYCTPSCVLYARRYSSTPSTSSR